MIIFSIFGFLGLVSLIYIAKPELLSSFVHDFPNLTQTDIPLSLLIVNFSLLTLGLLLSKDESNRSDTPLLASGLIIASSVNLLLSISFIFNILWSKITPTYLVFITIGVYLIKAGIPLFVYETKRSEKNKPSSDFEQKKNIADLKKIVNEIQSYLVENKINADPIKRIRLSLDKNLLDQDEFYMIVNQLSNEITRLELPEVLISKISIIKRIE